MNASRIDSSRAQALMTTAYAKFKLQDWELGRRWNAEGLTNPEKVAVLLGNMNYQVENGGLGQWYENGYGKEKGPNGTPAHIAIAALVDRHHDLDPEAAEAILAMMNGVEKTLREPAPHWDPEDEDAVGVPDEFAYLSGDDEYCDLSQERRLDFIDAIVTACSEADDPFDTDFSFYRLSERMARAVGPRA